MTRTQKNTLNLPSKLTILFLATVMLTLCSNAFAEQIKLMPVKQFAKSQGGPETFTQTFRVPPYTTQQYLWVKNGGDSLGQVRNFEVSVNGTVVLTSRDMRKGNPVLKNLIDVQLSDVNTLEVVLRGQSGKALYVEVLGETPPRDRRIR